MIIEEFNHIEILHGDVLKKYKIIYRYSPRATYVCCRKEFMIFGYFVKFLFWLESLPAHFYGFLYNHNMLEILPGEKPSIKMIRLPERTYKW